MPGAAQTTVYDVVTRYRVESDEKKVTALGRSADKTGKSLGTSTVAMAGLGRAARSTMLMLGPMIGATTAAAAAGIVMTKSFGGLNTELVQTNQLAAQFNLAFKFSADAGENFAISLQKSRQLVQGIIQDAAALPGEARDFFQIAGMIAGPAFAGGKSSADIRRMTGNLAIGASFAGINGTESARGALMMMTGRAGIEQPLFSRLQAAGLLPDAKTFNQQGAAGRFESLDAALTKLAGNPMFRKQILRTFEVQLGTLGDLLVGPAGIGGQLTRGPFNALLDGLVDLNKTLDTKVPSIVGGFRLLGESVRMIAGVMGAVADFGMLPATLGRDFGAWVAGNTSGQAGTGGGILAGRSTLQMSDINIAAGGAARRFGSAFGLSGADKRSIFDVTQNLELLRQTQPNISGAMLDDLYSRTISQGQQGGSAVTVPWLIHRLQTNFGDMLEAKDGAPSVQSSVVTNHVSIRVDLKSDDSPEAVAIKLHEGWDKFTRRPRSARRGLGSGSGPTAM